MGPSVPACMLLNLWPGTPRPSQTLFFMTAISDFLGRLLQGLFKLALLLAALVFVLSFLLAALVVVAAVSLWSLITGRKPAPLVMFSRMRAQSQRYTSGVWPQRSGAPAGADVVDVQASEVVEPGAAAECPATPGADGLLR